MKPILFLALFASTGCTAHDLVTPKWSPQQSAAALALSGQLMASPAPMAPVQNTRCYTNNVNGTYITRCMP